jgi:hypothetical protein
MLLLKILAVWFLISIITAFLFMILVNYGRGQCLFHGFNRRLVINTGTWEYFECPKCGNREAEKIEYATEYQPINRRWLNGGEWC